jgi:hypothetical protein
MNRPGLIALVHIARKDLGLDEETYRAVLEEVTGRSCPTQLRRSSASACTDAELSRVVDHFRSLGWTPKRRPVSKNGHVRKVWAVWQELVDQGAVRTPTREALRAFVRRMTGVEDPEWLTSRQANVVVEGLKAWAARHQAQAGEPSP